MPNDIDMGIGSNAGAGFSNTAEWDSIKRITDDGRERACLPYLLASERRQIPVRSQEVVCPIRRIIFVWNRITNCPDKPFGG